MQDLFVLNVHAGHIQFSIYNQTLMGQHIGAYLEETSAYCSDYLPLLANAYIDSWEIIQALRYIVNTVLIDKFYFTNVSYSNFYEQIEKEISHMSSAIQSLKK